MAVSSVMGVLDLKHFRQVGHDRWAIGAYRVSKHVGLWELSLFPDPGWCVECPSFFDACAVAAELFEEFPDPIGAGWPLHEAIARRIFERSAVTA